MLQAEAGEAGLFSPLLEPGLDVQEGDIILAVNGEPVGPTRSVGQALLHLAGEEVALTLARSGAAARKVSVRTLRSETALRYRHGVLKRQAVVHESSKGAVGYVHIPDMQPGGYAAFHRDYSRECERDALIVDLRSNGGGNMSQLILQILARRRIGFDQPRYGAPIPFFEDAPAGGLVAITDERAGSDGDIFSHCFKMLKLGPLVGTRTWGGVIGIWPRHPLVDGGTTTQPEFAFWFEDVGWQVENHGVEPDHEVKIRPQDFAAGLDPQLDLALALALKSIEEKPPLRPKLGPKPSKRAPKLN